MAVTQSNLITDMKFLRGKIGMLTILLLILMKGTDGPPVPPNKGSPVPPSTGPPVPPNKGSPVPPSTGPPVTVIKACAGEDKPLMTKDESAQKDIISKWIFRKGNVSKTTADIPLCQKDLSESFRVNPIYNSSVEQCNTTSIILKAISFDGVGYYILQILKEIIGITESLPIFLSVSDTPTIQCKPDMNKLSGHMLNCSTQCEQFDVEWIQNKGDVVGNGSIFPVDCLRKNESFMCCLKSKDMECYKGNKLDLCAPIPSNYCEENRSGENVPDVHADKVPDTPGSDLLGLLTLLIIPAILVAIYVLHRKEILPCPTMCRDKSIPCCSVSTQEPHADVNDVQEPEEIVSMLGNGQKPHADDNDDQVPEPDTDDNDFRVPEKTFPSLDADGQEVQQQEITAPMLDVGQVLDGDVQYIQEQDPVHEAEETGTEHQPNFETAIEIQELRDAVICKICFRRRMSVLFMPCNHMLTCDNCSSAFVTCPICRARIEEIKRVRYD